MPLITNNIPNLSGGVSQQPDAQRLPTQCEAQENAIPLLVGGLIKRPPTNHVSEIKDSSGSSLDLSGSFTHAVNRDDAEKFFITVKGDDTVHVTSVDGTAQTVHNNVAASGYLTSSTPQEDYRAVTIADVTFLLNTSKTAAMEVDTSPATLNSNEALIWIRGTGPNARFTVRVNGVNAASWTLDDLQGNVDDDDNIITPPSTTTIASHLATTMSSYTSSSMGSVVYMIANGTVTCEDSLGQAASTVIKGEVNKFSDLPPIAKHGMIVKVLGDPESDVDDYHCVFQANGGSGFGHGLWIETVAPGLKFKYDPTTMPHVVVRQADGTFVVKASDGLAPSTGNYTGEGAVDWSRFKFTDREAGDDLTNPIPSFVDNKILDIAFFKNRLVFTSGENCILSEAGFLFNFFRTTSTIFLETAVIDVGVGGTEINKLESAVPFSDRLILFSKRSQFALQGEGVLTPLTASINPVTNFDILTGVDPVRAGSNLFFAFNRGGFSGVREYFKTNETDINFDAVEVTSQVPKYINGEIRKLTISTIEDTLVALSRTKTGSSFNATNDLYIYKYFSTERGRLQSAWFKFTFSNCEIIDVEFINQSLFLIVKRGGKTFIERMDIQTGLVDEGAEYTTLLDRRLKIIGDGTLTPAGGHTLNLPYDIVDGDTIQVCDSTGEVKTIASQTSNTITLSEEFSASEVFFVGVPYTMRYELTTPVLKRPKEGGGYEMVSVGRHQLRYMTVVYDETAFFKVRYSTKTGGGQFTEPVEYPFSGRFLSSGGFLGTVPKETGKFRFPMFAESDNVKIEILNDSPLPSNIQSIEFEANYTSRSQKSI